jgi:hypothetical protein
VRLGNEQAAAREQRAAIEEGERVGVLEDGVRRGLAGDDPAERARGARGVSRRGRSGGVIPRAASRPHVARGSILQRVTALRRRRLGDRAGEASAAPRAEGGGVVTTQTPEPPPAPPDQPASVACDMLALLGRKLDLIALIDQCRQHARDARDSATLTLLDRLRQGELDDVTALLESGGGGPDALAARRWLAEAWRHGEVVADEDGVRLERGAGPVDRFAVAPPRAAPVAAAAAQPATPPEESAR